VPFVATGSGLAFVIAYLMPMWIAAIYFAGVLGVALYAWRAGALAPPRRSKSTPEWEKMSAEAAKKREEKYGPPWEPPVRGRWRLAVELQFGLFFVAALIALVRGEFALAAVLPVLSLLCFFYTRFVFPGLWWNWWAWVVLGTVGGVVFLSPP
jgi:hypothetical protein